jgi:ABC-type sulfate transport system substrate-binding protein
MILTQALLDAVGACGDGYNIGVQLGCLNIDSEAAITIFEANNYPRYADWVRALYSNQIALKISNSYTSIQYLVFDPGYKAFVSTTNQSDIAVIKDQIIFANPDSDPSLIVCYEEITSSIDGKVHRFLLT